MTSWPAGAKQMEKKRQKAIADIETKIEYLTTKSEELTAACARLNTDMKNLESAAS